MGSVWRDPGKMSGAVGKDTMIGSHPERKFGNYPLSRLEPARRRKDSKTPIIVSYYFASRQEAIPRSSARIR